MIEIDATRYSKMTRKRALALLERAELTPDKFIAHKDKTFTAKFRRKRKETFKDFHYEERMEKMGEHRLAILKRPNVRIDRGPYITMRFAFASLEQLGLDNIQLMTKGILTNGKTTQPGVSPDVIDPFTIIEIARLAQDLKNLAREASSLAKEENIRRDHLHIILDELNKHADELIHKLD
jgi:arsenate reductase-like glutaredoxin family protein